MKTAALLLSFAALALATSGCAILDALDTYHYVGIYEVSYRNAGIAKDTWPSRFDLFCEALRKETALEVKEISRDAISKSAFIVLTGDTAKTLSRVVISESKWSEKDEELSLSIIKVPAGEDRITTELKSHIEKALDALGLHNWHFYIQKSHGQLWNS